MVLEKTSVIKGQNQDVGCPSFIDFFLRKQMKLVLFMLCHWPARQLWASQGSLSFAEVNLEWLSIVDTFVPG